MYKMHTFAFCDAGANPGGGPKGCCFNYWWPDVNADHGVTNLTEPVPGHKNIVANHCHKRLTAVTVTDTVVGCGLL